MLHIDFESEVKRTRNEIVHKQIVLATEVLMPWQEDLLRSEINKLEIVNQYLKNTQKQIASH